MRNQTGGNLVRMWREQTPSHNFGLLCKFVKMIKAIINVVPTRSRAVGQQRY